MSKKVFLKTMLFMRNNVKKYSRAVHATGENTALVLCMLDT